MYRLFSSAGAGSLLLAGLMAWSADAAATLIAPHALFVDHRVRSAAIYLHNPDDKPVEVSIELIYGYPRGDGEGGVKVFLDPDPAETEPSCASWIRALPRRVTLEPGQRQTIRLLAQPPVGLPDGEYWSRVAITSVALEREGESQPVEGADGVRVGLDLQTRTIISLNYRKGPVRTGIEVGDLGARIDGDALTVDMDLRRQGDAAWLGRVDATLLDTQGKELKHWDRAVAVYDDHHRSLSFDLDRNYPAGSYTLSLTWSTARDDLPPEGVLPAATVVRAIPILVMEPLAK